MDGQRELLEELRPVIADDRVLEAVAALPRERFVPEAERARAYQNVALPIDCEQTISQPLVVARMLEVLGLAPTDRVLDVGTGSGYHAALLAGLAGHVWTIERHAELSREANAVLSELGIDNVTFVVGDGYEGLSDHAPFDAINIAAAVGDEVPAALREQLAVGGRLVAPIGSVDQHLVLVHRDRRGFHELTLEPVRFVPLIRSSHPAEGSAPPADAE